MKVKSILKAKGTHVETVGPHDILSRVLSRFTSMGIGALVVMEDGRVLGVLSEGDIVAGLKVHGARVLDKPAGALMTRNVPVCSPEDSLRSVMAQMTRTRNRHLPVIDEGRLSGIVSLGDVVKHRLEEMELEAQVLREAYIVHR